MKPNWPVMRAFSVYCAQARGRQCPRYTARHLRYSSRKPVPWTAVTWEEHCM